jgi:hypothetical protein
MSGASFDVPTSLDELVADSRARIERLREAYGSPEDFDHFIGAVIETALAGYAPHAKRFTLRALGLGETHAR